MTLTTSNFQKHDLVEVQVGYKITAKNGRTYHKTYLGIIAGFPVKRGQRFVLYPVISLNRNGLVKWVHEVQITLKQKYAGVQDT